MHDPARRFRPLARFPAATLIVTAMLVVLLAGCRPAPSAAAPPDAAKPPAGGATAAWDRLVTEARAEGELVVIAGSTHSRNHRPVFDAFSRTFGIKVVVGAGSGAANVQRVLVERSRGRFTADVSLVGTSSNQQLCDAGALVPLRPLFLHPEVADRSRGWRISEPVWLDTQRAYVAASTLTVAENLSSIYYNSERVSPEELARLRSWQDFLRPEWRGRIVAILEPNNDGKMLSLMNSWRVLGPDWFGRFMREAKPALLPGGSLREVADGLARGKFHAAMFVSDAKAELDKMQAIGLPVRKLARTLQEGGDVSFSGAIGVFERAPHPNAARLFLNWYLSREGQTVRQTLIDEAEPSASLRSDVPQGKVSDHDWRQVQAALPDAAAARGSAEWVADTAALTTFLKEMSRELRIYGY